MRLLGFILAAALALGLASGVAGCTTSGPSPAASLVPMAGGTGPSAAFEAVLIRGWERWCAAHDRCGRPPPDPSWRADAALLERVQRRVNAAATYWEEGAEDVWRSAAATGMGDCEDFAIAKEDELLAAGVPRAQLRFAAPLDRHGKDHIVLVVMSGGRWLALDHQRPGVVPAAALGYTRWLLEPPRIAPGTGALWERFDP